MPLPLLLSLPYSCLFLSVLFFPTYFSYEGYKTCEPFSCGKFRNLSYPFWRNDQPSYCGHPKFKLDCQRDQVTIDMLSQKLLVLDINKKLQILKIARLDLLGDDHCPKEYTDFNLDFAFFNYTSNDYNCTLFYGCPPFSHPLYHYLPFNCPIDDGEAFLVSSYEVVLFKFLGCKNIIVPVLKVAMESYYLDGKNVLEKGFEVEWSGVDENQCYDCKNSGGRCGHNASMNAFMCLCPNHQLFINRNCEPPEQSFLPPYTPSYLKESPHAKGTLNLERKIIIGVASLVFGALVVFFACYVWYRRKKNSYAMSYIQSRSLSSDPSLKDTEKGSLNIVPGVHLFSYTELEEATNYFDSSRELGEGGFGTVYFGKLHDGRCVAVKRLYENNYRRVEQFMNEIKILARLVHPNLVTLYGCTSRHGRELLLVYEYISNGTVADHLHGERTKPGTLSWQTRMNIAVETASALKYLHVSDIIHRDVKTNNILLDSHFRVKVADFGLSRLFPTDVTHISTAPQGTPGYVDPEYHECYQLTSKSDVYSFGVVLIELISSLPAVDITRHRHEINLANMAINKIHSQALHELVDPTLGFESDEKVRKMINAVAELAFQCLQSSKDMRPSMEEVLDTLKDIQSGGKHKSQPEVMDIISSADDVVLLKDNPPPPSPDSNAVSKSTTPNASG